VLVTAAMVFVVGLLWGIHHLLIATAVLKHSHVHTSQLALIYSVTFLSMCWQIGSAYFEKVYRYTSQEQERKMDQKRVVAIVPAYNESVEALKSCIESLFNQTRKPDMVYVVDDGS